MEIEEKINELLAQEKGIKKWVRKVVYKAAAPLIYAMIEEQHKAYGLEEQVGACGKRLDTLETNIRNNNQLIAVLQENARVCDQRQQMRENKLQMNEKKLGGLFEYAQALSTRINQLEAADAVQKVPTSEAQKAAVQTEKQKPQSAGSNSAAESNTYEGIDYFDFENHFRGSDDQIRAVQEQYLPYFENCSNVIDIGCGRGEFLELLASKGVSATGIDLYGKSIDYCRIKGLNVKQTDAISYIENLEEEIDGIFAGQLVEHLTIEQIIRLCRVSYEKLKKGSYLIMETPNPTSLAIYTHAFYMDPSHVKPVHPLTLKYCTQKAGFSAVEILYTENSKLPVEIPALKASGIENLEDFNQAMREVSTVLFGSQDYAVIAKK